MHILSILTATAAPRLIWCTVTSNAIFDRVWNLALLSLLLLTTLLFDFPTNGHRFYLSCLLFFDLILFLSLSPLQVLLFNRWAPYAKFDRLEIIHPKQKDEDDQTEPQDEILVDIVAVHGLGSDPKNAWRQGNCDWLRDLLPQEGIPARIMIFSHNSSWGSNALDKYLVDHGQDLLRALSRVRTTTKQASRPIVFIGHSFGGLIIKRALVSSALTNKGDPGFELYKHTKGLIFLGTPHKGANLTTAGRAIALFNSWQGSDIHLLKMLNHGEPDNRKLHMEFMQVLPQSCGVANTVCVFEAVREFFCGIAMSHVVDYYSAVIDGSEAIGFEKQHRGLQRFDGRSDPGYQDLLYYLLKWCRKT